MNPSREGINIATHISNLVANTLNFVANALGLVANATQTLTNIPLKHSENITPYHQQKAPPLNIPLDHLEKLPYMLPKKSNFNYYYYYYYYY